ncbi:MAG: class I SAM-dependent methyltransferase [Actinomycetales bacterium]|jgi:SAM-dependent methyltransferase|uniref:Class I SAM-dependent methyltransferase n=1 Tax=Candidatus Phosphoribacter hodrii TaxID=2953743 RepID=A0A934X2N4_9MICO|nr:class I SAM-dependent methyltransferase [Candidatus Phosphoribacter hodrii]
MDDYLDINRANWDERAPAHAGSEGYAVRRLVSDPAALSGVVEFDRPLLGDIAGLRGVHLQCHIGTDTLSLHRLGARMSGLDFSPAALHEARALAAEAGAEIDYVESTVDGAVAAFGAGGFDLVYTGIGALCWLPRIRDWAQTVATLLRPGGRLFIREGHPMLWAMADPTGPESPVAVGYTYFEQPDAVVWDEPGTYVETEVEFQHNVTHSWNHGLGEIVTALLDVGMVITGLVEHDSVPWEALPGLMVLDERGEWRLRENPERLAASYTLQAVKAR